MKKLCIRCNGTGKFMGNGFMVIDCTLCNEDNIIVDVPHLDKINRKSKSYQQAVKEIMESSPGITRSEAVQMFNEAYEKN